MTVKQLKDALEKYPDNMDVFLADRKTEFTYGLLNTVKTDEVTFLEDPSDYGGEDAPKVECVILDEE